jgi:exodeoxyribonuclease-3
MKIASWNVNSIRARQERVLAWLAAESPDVLCLQELKAIDEQFPVLEYQALGYESAVYGQRTYNGVAILARSELTQIERGVGPSTADSQARFIAASVRGLRVASVYVPNGETVASEKFAYKLAWMARLKVYAAAQLAAREPLLLCGDFNIAPEPIDVHDPVRWDGHVMFSKPERAAFAELLGIGLVDVVRELNPDQALFTWWDYRQLSFPKNYGLRIDHVLAAPVLRERMLSARVDRNARKGLQPSDHAPVVVELAER